MSEPTAIVLPPQIYHEIIAHARAGAPEEVCGILAGRAGVATELVRGRNEAANPIMDYWVDGQTLLKQFEFEDRGEEMIAIYHSHPVDEAFPSATDARNAFYPDAVYLICSLLRPDRPVVRGFRLIQEELGQRPEGLRPVRGNPAFLAAFRADAAGSRYELAIAEPGQRERWLRVWVVEVPVVVSEEVRILDKLPSPE
ncbi:MAG: M67 family metallopeptidase [Caldilineales bacterium]|nr:M67 family metallopeptidase [Caldilineales bacterium]MDW8316474.1 M67 family metallopeptidase [Anaerolineae bacterium]